MDGPANQTDAAIVSAKIQLQSLEVLASIDKRMVVMVELLERLVALIEAVTNHRRLF
jgi:hypothetical protein